MIARKEKKVGFHEHQQQIEIEKAKKAKAEAEDAKNSLLKHNEEI